MSQVKSQRLANCPTLDTSQALLKARYSPLYSFHELLFP